MQISQLQAVQLRQGFRQSGREALFDLPARSGGCMDILHAKTPTGDTPVKLTACLTALVLFALLSAGCCCVRPSSDKSSSQTGQHRPAAAPAGGDMVLGS
jgi:hypothetical protein